jgi:hypothetical protein
MSSEKLVEPLITQSNEKGQREPGIVYTFYSYKGGVGRSMALVNVGVLLALSELDPTRTTRVLLIDWDLEAPGLEVYFQKSNNSTLQGDPNLKFGILDLLEALREKREISWKDCLLEVLFTGGSLHLITSGSKGIVNEKAGDYRARVQKLDWNDLFVNHNVGNYVDNMRRELIDAYDYILVDSRTGTTDIGDICTVLFADVLVLGFISNYQNVDGIANAVKRAHIARAQLPNERGRLIAVPVPMRDEKYTEYDKETEWRKIYKERLGDLFN